MDRKYLVTEDGVQYRVWDYVRELDGPLGPSNAPMNAIMILEYQMLYWAVGIGKWRVKSGVKRKAIA